MEATDIILLVQALAWPITIFCLATLFRREVRGILERLSHLKYKELEATFVQGLREVELIATKAALPAHDEVPESNTSSRDIEARLSRLVQISPRAAITEAWIEVEAAASNAAKQFNVPGEIIANKTRLMQHLRQKGMLTEEVLVTYNHLRALRNEASHAREFALPVSETERYVDLAKGLAAYIRYKGQSNAS